MAVYYRTLFTARLAGSRVTFHITWVNAVRTSFFLANFSTTVRQIITVIFGFSYFTTEAVILRYFFSIFKIAFGTHPVVITSFFVVFIIFVCKYPFFGARKMERLITSFTVPNFR